MHLNTFASKAATSAVIVGTPVMIYNFLLTVLSQRHFRISANAFHFFPRNNGRGTAQVDLPQVGLASVKSSPGCVLRCDYWVIEAINVFNSAMTLRLYSLLWLMFVFFLQNVPNFLEKVMQLFKLYLTTKCLGQKEFFHVAKGVTCFMEMEQNDCQRLLIAILMHLGLDNTALSVGRVWMLFL